MEQTLQKAHKDHRIFLFCFFSLKLAWKRQVPAGHLVHLHPLFSFVPSLCFCNVYILAFLHCLFGFRAFPLSISHAKKKEKKKKKDSN